MILNNVKMAGGGDPVNVTIKGEQITGIASSPIPAADGDLTLHFDNALIFPGLTNSHDHLDFNLFTQLGNRVYSNYTEWGRHIHKKFRREIREVLNIPASLRTEWGIYKNLLCGVTTVVNHGARLGKSTDLITVFEETQCLHSIHFEKRWRIKLNNPFNKNLPVNIHVGEGTDGAAYHEIDQLTRWNLLNKKLIGVHAVAMTERQAKKFKALVWCPQSNHNLLNKTAPIDLLKAHSVLLFGTDSTLTSDWNMWHHLQSARETNLLSDDLLYKSLTENAAQTWGLNSGKIAAGKDADLVVAKTNNGNNSFDAFFGIGPDDLLLVMHRGNIRLFDETLLDQLKHADISDFSKIYVNGIGKYVQGDLPGLMENIRNYQPAAEFPISVTKRLVA